MIEMALLEESKQTERKVRCDAHVEGALFSLYIPKWRIPEPWPPVIRVTISPFTREVAPRLTPIDAIKRPLSRAQAIVTHLDLVSMHTKTVRISAARRRVVVGNGRTVHTYGINFSRRGTPYTHCQLGADLGFVAAIEPVPLKWKQPRRYLPRAVEASSLENS